MKERNLGILHSGIEDCETMHMVSSFCVSRIEDRRPPRMVAACQGLAIMASSYRFSRIEDFGTMRMVSSYLFWVALGPICVEMLAWPRTDERTWLEMTP